MTLDSTTMQQPIAWWDHETRTDIVIVGAGIAGLSFALRLPPALQVIIVTKGPLGDSNTRTAQGGLAAAISPGDNVDLHLQDTLAAGAGLADITPARTLVENGPDAVRWLLSQGTTFDSEGNMIALGHEAAHSHRRILHAGGDATGAEIQRALVDAIRSRPNTTIIEQSMAIDLALTDDGVAGGVITLGHNNEPHLIAAPITVLANGGAGHLWSVTSNPEGATADGIAMAIRAGADVADLEFTQFHPTVLNVPGVKPFLISEAVRGEGAWLTDARGDRFMLDIDPRAELAPRNVVAGAIQQQMLSEGSLSVNLDLRHLDPALVRRRFPNIERRLQEIGIDLTTDMVPVAPAAHYFMGGIVAGTDGTTSIPGLLALGEVSCTGVHGANRLASNSLLEGLVFGLKAADMIAQAALPERPVIRCEPLVQSPSVDIQFERTLIQQAMSAHVSVVRDEEGLREASSIIRSAPMPTWGAQDAHELRNIALVAAEITTSALLRQESRGGHIRLDFPSQDSELDGKHQIVSISAGEVQRQFGPLVVQKGHCASGHQKKPPMPNLFS